MHAERETRMQNRDDRIVFFYYPILSCLWKMISDPNLYLVEIIQPYPKSIWKCIMMRNIYFGALSISPHEAK